MRSQEQRKIPWFIRSNTHATGVQGSDELFEKYFLEGVSGHVCVFFRRLNSSTWEEQYRVCVTPGGDLHPLLQRRPRLSSTFILFVGSCGERKANGQGPFTLKPKQKGIARRLFSRVVHHPPLVSGLGTKRLLLDCRCQWRLQQRSCILESQRPQVRRNTCCSVGWLGRVWDLPLNPRQKWWCWRWCRLFKLCVIVCRKKQASQGLLVPIVRAIVRFLSVDMCITHTHTHTHTHKHTDNNGSGGHLASECPSGSFVLGDGARHFFAHY